MFIQNVMIAARARGLEICPQETFSKYHALLREVLPIPPEEMVVCGVSIGFAQPAHSDQRLMDRVPVDEFAINVTGQNYRRNRILEPSPETFHFSITAVYMDSKDSHAIKDENHDVVLRGQYHGHPYGELNVVVPLDQGAQLKGLQG